MLEDDLCIIAKNYSASKKIKGNYVINNEKLIKQLEKIVTIYNSHPDYEESEFSSDYEESSNSVDNNLELENSPLFNLDIEIINEWLSEASTSKSQSSSNKSQKM